MPSSLVCPVHDVQWIALAYCIDDGLSLFGLVYELTLVGGTYIQLTSIGDDTIEPIVLIPIE